MAEVFEFDPAALRALASDMGTVAEDIRAVTGTNEPLQGVARALPGSLTGAACTAAAPRVVDALDDVSQRITVVGEAVTTAVGQFIAAQQQFERDLRNIGGL